MTFRLVTAPAPILTVAEAKRHLNVLPDTTDDDLYIDGLIQAVTGWADGPDGWLGRCLGPQTWDWLLDADSCSPWYDPASLGVRNWLTIPLRTCLSVDSITYVDADGASQAWTDFDVLGAGQGTVGAPRIRPAWNTAWPSVRAQAEAVTIRITAGYAQGDGQSPEGLVEAVPGPLRQGLLLFVGELYDQRASAASEPGEAAERLLARYRVYR